MNLFRDAMNRSAWLALLFVCTLTLAGGCATVAVHTESLPPILNQDELLRPYEKVANIEVRRDRYGDVEDLTPEDYTWAYVELRKEAGKIGADAVMLPEVRIEIHRYIFYPTSHIRANGIAIKFR